MLIVALTGCSRAEPLLGTVLESSDAAPTFELQDQFGRPSKLADLRGQVTVLTFLYTYCPDICPVVTDHLRKAREMLGDDADRVAFVAISVDPDRDTVERAHEYSEQWGMLRKWSFLVGDEEELAPVWKAYYIDPGRSDSAHDESAVATESGSRDHDVASAREDVPPQYEVAHSAPVYLIDQEGLLRVLFTLPFDPDALAHDVRLLLD